MATPAYRNFRSWRDFNRRLHVASEQDREQAQEFVARAADVRDQVVFLLRNGLNEGAVEALSALAESDMADFCILVDLAEGVAIPDVEPLDDDTQRHLAEFLDDDPWHSLAVDTDVPVVLAMHEAVAEEAGKRRWFEVAPNLVAVMSDMLSRANTEQINRFAADLRALQQRTGLRIPADVADITNFVLDEAAERLGIRQPSIDPDSD